MKKMLRMISAAVLLMAFTAGAVTEETYYALGLEGTLQASGWFTFEYTEIETTPARYAQMINSFFMGSGNSYYNYNWY